MLGIRKAQRALFDVGNVFPVALDPASFHGQLAGAAERLFRDADFAAFYADGLGRPSAPPSLLALLTLRQHECGCSDAEATNLRGTCNWERAQTAAGHIAAVAARWLGVREMLPPRQGRCFPHTSPRSQSTSRILQPHRFTLSATGFRPRF